MPHPPYGHPSHSLSPQSTPRELGQARGRWQAPPQILPIRGHVRIWRGGDPTRPTGTLPK
jgi:hypothetical protein